MRPSILSGCRILITGAGSGIGRATAETFAAEGATIAALDINFAAAQQVASDIQGFAIGVDVTNEDSVLDAVARAAQAMGGIDGVINAAGITELGPVQQMSFASWRRVIAVNLEGPFLVCRAAIPWLVKANAATIVNIASASALQPFAGGAAYAASKGGLLNLTRVLAKELAPGVRANTVCPGLVDTPMIDAIEARASRDPSGSSFSLSMYALQRKATAVEIAAAILFLTSTESSFMTGSTLVVDGGRTFY